MNIKLTDWYESWQKPIRKGFYQCKCCNDMFYWNGKHWSSAPWDKSDWGMGEWRGIKINARS